MPVYTGTVYRCANLPQSIIDKYKPGESVVEKAFTSTSSDRKVAAVFDRDRDESSVTYIINSTKGRSLHKINPSEKEILYPPNQKFKVLKVEKHPNGGHLIYMSDD
jgi:hypothetical protein